MPWTTPKVWVTGHLVTANDMNAYVRDNLNYVYTISRIKTTNSVAYTLVTNATVNMNHNTAIYNVNCSFTPGDGFFTLAGFDSGLWALGASIGHASVANTGIRSLQIWYTTSSLDEYNMMEHTVPVTTTNPVVLNINTQYVLNQAYYGNVKVTYKYRQSQGASITGLKDGDACPAWWGTWLGV